MNDENRKAFSPKSATEFLNRELLLRRGGAEPHGWATAVSIHVKTVDASDISAYRFKEEDSGSSPTVRVGAGDAPNPQVSQPNVKISFAGDPGCGCCGG